MMKTRLVAITIALTVAAQATPSIAQSSEGWRAGDASGQRWDRETFWRGAPTGLRERIDWLQQRINRGMSDGSIDRRESRDLQYQLDGLRREASALDQRLDDLSRRIRWTRREGASYGRYGDDDGDRFATDYDAARDYRDDPRYSERRLSGDDYVYRGSDGRYYCKRSDGTTGLIIGAAGGGILGNVIDGGRHRTAGTLVGGALGALLGRSVDQNSDVRCR